MNFKFKNPKKKKIIIFDGTTLSDLKYLIKEKNYSVLENRKERIKIIYCGLNFLINFTINLFLLFLKVKNIHTIYLYTVIRSIGPKIVITNIDNSFKFSDLAKLLEKKIKFVAIQNSNRFDYLHNYQLYKKKFEKNNINKKYFIPNFFCFGDYEINQAKKFNIFIKNFYPVGSLRVSNFFEYIKLKNIKLNKKKFDICLISDAAYDLDERLIPLKDKLKIITITKFVIKYCKKYKLKFAFLHKNFVRSKDNKLEINFYKKHLNKKDFDYLIKNSIFRKHKFSSYLGLFQSKIAVGCISTLLREKLGCNEKILCPVINTKMLDFPINGICVLKKINFLAFEKRLNLIMKLNIQQYIKKNNKPIKYIMSFDKNLSTLKKIISNLF